MAHIKHTTWHRQRGLTLVELMVTIAVIAILATTAVSTMSNMRAKQQVIAAAEDIASTFQRARSLAVKKSENTELEFFPPGLAKQFGLTLMSGEISKSLVIEHPKLKFSMSRDTSQKLIFDSVRGTADQAGSICIAPNAGGLDESDYEAKVVLSPNGRVRICSRTGLNGRYPTDECGACDAS